MTACHTRRLNWRYLVPRYRSLLLSERHRMQLGTEMRRSRSSPGLQRHRLRKHSADYLIRHVRIERNRNPRSQKVIQHTESPVHVRFTSVGIVKLALQLTRDAVFKVFPSCRLIVRLIQTRDLARSGVCRRPTNIRTRRARRSYQRKDHRTINPNGQKKCQDPKGP